MIRFFSLTASSATSGAEGSLCPPTDGEVHLWQFDLAAAQAELEKLTELLSPDERARAARLRFQPAHARFIAGRGMLRIALARYLKIAPATLSFTYTAQGKPLICGGELSFNLAHSHDVALLAVANGPRVGVDLELIGDANYEAIANHFFAPTEQQALLGLPLEQRRAAFYRAWTCKEAVLKAQGDGLALGLGHFTVSIDPAKPAALTHASDPTAIERWRIHSWQPAEGFIAALAVE